MNIEVKVVAGARRRAVEKQADGTYKVWTNAVRENGKANGDVVELLAEHFGIGRSSIEIVRGHATSRKTIKISAP